TPSTPLPDTYAAPNSTWNCWGLFGSSTPSPPAFELAPNTENRTTGYSNRISATYRRIEGTAPQQHLGLIPARIANFGLRCLYTHTSIALIVNSLLDQAVLGASAWAGLTWKDGFFARVAPGSVGSGEFPNTADGRSPNTITDIAILWGMERVITIPESPD